MMVLKLSLDIKMVQLLNNFIILPQMSGFVKCFEKNKKHVIFSSWWGECNFEIQQNLGKNKKLLSVEFDSKSVYDEKYIKTRVKTFQDKVITKFTDSEIPKQNTHYSCIAAICVDSVIKLEKENYLQVNVEQYKFRLNKMKNIDLFDDE